MSELHEKWRKHWIEYDRASKKWRNTYPHPKAELPSIPPECIGMTCGARTRAGTPCKRKDLYISGRCKLHGGLSTGPRTEEGKRRSALNWMKRRNLIKP